MKESVDPLPPSPCILLVNLHFLFGFIRKVDGSTNKQRVPGQAGLDALRSSSHPREEEDDPELQAAIRASKKEFEASKRSQSKNTVP